MSFFFKPLEQLLITFVATASFIFADNGYNALSFYVSAHQDDWELFRGDIAASDLHRTGQKVVFIYATAGDAGRRDGWWEAREQGAIAATRKMIAPSPLTIDIANFNGHPIIRYSCKNSVSYFLRLPDGKYQSGKGYPINNNESLTQLRDSGKAIVAVDNSTTYNSWNDFTQTLQAIMQYEHSLVPTDAHPWVNASDYFGSDNSNPNCHTLDVCSPCDHPDHIALGDALRSFVAGTFSRAWWVSYASWHHPENIDKIRYALKGEVFFAYANSVFAQTSLNGNPASPEYEEWHRWGRRDYARTLSWDQNDSNSPTCVQ